MKKGLDFQADWEAFIEGNDEIAFHALYSYYFKYLANAGIRKGFSTVRVHDNINDVFLYLWEKRNALTAVKNFHNYIITVFLRKLYQKESILIDESVELHDFPELQITPSVENQHILTNNQQEAAKILKTVVDKLPEKQKHMVYQKFYLGLSYKQISESNQVSINTVYNTVYKALENLKKEMSKEQLAALVVVLSLISLYFFIFL